MDLKVFFFLRLHCLILSVFIISYFSNSVWWRAQQPPLIKDKSIHPGHSAAPRWLLSFSFWLTDSASNTSCGPARASVRVLSHLKGQRHSRISPGSGSCRTEGWRRPSLCSLRPDRSTQTGKTDTRAKRNWLETLNQSLCASSLRVSASRTTPSCVSKLSATRSPSLESLQLHLKSKSYRPPACLALIRQVPSLLRRTLRAAQKFSSCLRRLSKIPQSRPKPGCH